MKRRIRNALYVQIFLFLAVIAWGQNISRQGKNRYATDDIKISSHISSEKVIAIKSAINLSGTLTIKAADNNDAVFNYKKLMKTPGEAEAVDYANLIEVSLEETSSGGELMLQAPNPAPWSGTDNSGVIEGELLLPHGCKIQIDAQYFDIKVSGPFKSVENQSSFGRLEINDIQESVNLTTSNRDIIGDNISGEINLTTSHADIVLTNMTTSGQPAYLRNENGNINGENISGALDIKNSFGRIKLGDLRLIADRSRISGSYSPINLKITGINDAGLTVFNTNEDIEVFVPKSFPAEFSLRVDTNGEIDVEGLKVKPVLVDSDRIDFISGDGSHRIRMSVRGDGNISVRNLE